MDSRLTQDLNGAPLLRQKRQRFSFLILFIGIFVFVAAAGALYYALRPETLRIAVGPPDSDDQKLIQALAQSFARQRSAVRLAPIPTNGPTESLALLGADKADLAVARGDLDMPAEAGSSSLSVLWHRYARAHDRYVKKRNGFLLEHTGGGRGIAAAHTSRG